MQAGIYTRISRNESGDQLGVRRQEKACRQLCEELGWQVADVWTDNDVSAYSGRRRPGYEALMAAAEAGEIGAVVAWHPDRLHRSPVELERFIDVVEAGKLRVRTVQSGELDLTTAGGRMTARVVGAVARHESEHKSARLRAKAAELAEAGAGAGGGTRPFGFEADRLTVNKAEAKEIRAVVRRLLAGESLRGLCADLTARGVRTPTGREWKPSTLRRMLLSARLAGLRSHHGVVRAKAMWPAIITADEHAQVVALLTDPDRRTNRAPRRYLLTGGLAVCGLCGAGLVARPKSDGRRCYVCATGPGFEGCGKIRCLADPLEELVAEAVLGAIEGAELPDSTPDDDDGAGERLTELDARRVELAEMFAMGEMGRAEFGAARRRIEAERSALVEGQRDRRSTAALEGVLGSAKGVRKAWAGLSLDRRKAVVAAVVDVVTVGPAVRGRNTFDPSRVGIRWRA